MRTRWGTATAAALVAWCLATAVLLLAATTGDSAMRSEAWGALLACTPSVVLGVLVAVRRPETPGATALVALGTMSAIAEAVTVWGASAASPSPWPAASLGARLAVGIWVLHLGGFVLLCLVFPDGLLPARFWRLVGLGYVAVAAAVVLTSAISASAHPSFWVAVELVEAAALLAVLSCSVGCLVVRFRRGGEITRDQLRWLALGAGSVVVLWVLGEIAQTLGASVSWSYTPCILALLVLLPVTVAVAVVRHDLFDVERLLTESVTWVLTTLAAAAVFALVVALALRATQALGTTASYAVAAFVTAVALGPLHGRLHDLVGRVLDRDRTVRLEMVRRFVRQVRDGERPPQDLDLILREALRDPEAQIVLDVPGQGPANLDGEPVTDRPGIDVRSGEVRLGTLALGRPSLRRQRLGRLLVKEAALPLEVARAQVQLRAALLAVEESRSRMLVAGAEERRRLERDLHDGAQQRLVAVGMRLRSVQRRADDAPLVRAELDQAVAELEETVRELRRLARGLRPVGLDDGLRAAVQQLVHRSPVPTSVEIDDVELPEAVLTTAYFIVSEGVANALKHAEPSHVRVRAQRRADGRLLVEVDDNGCGGAAGVADLTTLRDRVTAVGGTLEVCERIPVGTVLRAVL